jgi:hypothetical protein
MGLLLIPSWNFSTIAFRPVSRERLSDELSKGAELPLDSYVPRCIGVEFWEEAGLSSMGFIEYFIDTR